MPLAPSSGCATDLGGYLARCGALAQDEHAGGGSQLPLLAIPSNLAPLGKLAGLFVAPVGLDRPTAPRSPWQNGYAERLIGSIRRECLDHVIVFGERHLRHVLRAYQQYYNGTRTHLALAKDSPLTRSVQTIGRILPLPILGGLHHRYVRI